MHKWLELSFYLICNLKGKATKYQWWQFDDLSTFYSYSTYSILKGITCFFRALEAVEGSTDSDDSESSESLGKAKK